jgi:F-type H+-transporting ATPase subunit c
MTYLRREISSFIFNTTYLFFLTVFLVGMKIIAMALCLLPLTGCALGIGLVFSGLLYGLTRNPSAYDTVFGLSLLGMSLIEMFAFICLIAAFFVVYF